MDENLEILMKQCLPKEAPIKKVNTPSCRGPLETLASRKKEARKCARELGYSQAIIEAIERAQTIYEVDRAMTRGRHAMSEFSPIEELKSPTGRKKRKDYNR